MWPTVRFSRSGEERHRRGLRRVVSQNSTACVLPAGESPKRLLERAAFRPSSVDMLGGPESPLGGPTRSAIELPRKEVIQPHLPVRLPCYDFTPITSPTFDGCLP